MTTSTGSGQASDLSDLVIPQRNLLGPGPSNVNPRVYRAMMQPVIGYLDPMFIKVIDDTQRPLRTVFRTENDLTMAISGTGTCGMEAAVYNITEAGDNVIVCLNGFFGTRIADMVKRCGGNVIPVEAEFGNIIEPDQIRLALKSANGPVKSVMIVHGETSTGILQPMQEICQIAHEQGALVLADAVTSLAGCELLIDEWGIDVCYSGTQKCLSAPPGMSPLTMSAAAVEAIEKRREPVLSFYVDLAMLGRYWGGGTTRMYHHTPPMSMLYALREGLRIVLEEGLEARIARHKRNAAALQAGLEAMGLVLHAQEGYRLPPLTTVRIPEGIDDMKLRRGILEDHNIEIGGGIGHMQGKILRIGLMGYGSTEPNVFALLFALEQELLAQGYGLDKGAGVAAAVRSYDNSL
ncbi:MAG TPA: alanine--glyoxylate aminotransferase family protein [Dehalococcoidia bacterium]|nr:alanine--glyoxylate aminotransferase family protein [Dehalococcoidia bacterium]